MGDKAINVPPWTYGSKEELRKWLNIDPGPFDALIKSNLIPPPDLKASKQSHYWKWDTAGAVAVLLPFLLSLQEIFEEKNQAKEGQTDQK